MFLNPTFHSYLCFFHNSIFFVIFFCPSMHPVWKYISIECYWDLYHIQGDNFKIGQTLRFVQKWKMMWMFPLFYVVSCLFSWFFKSPGVLYLFWELWSTLNSTMTDPSSSCTKCLLKTTPPPLGYPLVPGGVRREFQNLISGVWCSTIKF